MKTTTDPIDKYTFIKKLGEGSFGEVWLVHDPDVDEDVALKYLRLSEEGEEYLELFKREFQILSEIRHTNLANVFDFGFSHKQDQYFFTSEYCPGEEFIEALADKPLSYIEEALVQTLAALDYVHSQGIVHFDIKSDNILIEDRDGKPFAKILDFGVAAKLKALPQGVTGTPSYMAPEIVSKGASVDHRVDLYSLGMLLLRTLTGKLPFDTSDTNAVLNWHVKGSLPPEIWEHVEIPNYMRELVEKLLAKKAANRFSNARVVLHFLNVSTGRKYLKAEQDLAGKIPREGPLVERDELMQRLRACLEASLSPEKHDSQHSICTISGPQGMGKSRILNEMRHQLELEEIPFFDAICDWQVPTWPKIESWLGIHAAVSPEMSEEWQVRVYVDELLKEAAKRPFCLLIDEYHKADRMLANIMPAVAERLQRMHKEGDRPPIFILIATEDPLEGSFALKRLSAEAISKYIKLVLGETEQADAVAQLLYQYSGGLPLLMVEGLRFLAPHLYRDEPLENLLPPPQIGALYREKIDALAQDENELLSTLALLFRPAGDNELTAILGAREGTVAALADACIRDELISTTSSGEGAHLQYQVSSQALSLDIIQSLSPRQSSRLHKKIAQGLSSAAGTPLNEIAYHTAKAGDIDTAISYYMQAATEYKEQRQVSTATDCLTKAIGFAQPGAASWNELLQEASQLLIVSGQYTEAAGYLKKLKRSQSPAVEELRGLLALKQQKLEDARIHYRKALTLLPADDVFQRILIENALANADLQERNYDKAIATFRKTLEDEKRLGPSERFRISNNSLGLALALTGDVEGAFAFYNQRIDECPADRTAEMLSLENAIGYVLFQASRYEEAIPHLQKAVALAEKSGALHALFSSIGNLISALLKEADYAEALALIQKMSTYQERLGTQRDIAYNLLREGSIYLTVGMEEAAHGCLQRGRVMAQEIGDRGLAAWFLLMEGYRENEYGTQEKAKELLLLAELEARELGDNDLASWVHYSLADIAFEEGNWEKSRLQLEIIVDIPQDDEFKLRLQLIKAKLAAPTHQGDLESLFKPIITKCIQDQLKELLWEIHYSWARAEKERGNRTTAIPLAMEGIRIIEGIVNALPEEYRDRYLKQRSRSKLFALLKELTGPARSPEKTAPKADLFAARTAGTREGTTAEGPAGSRAPAEGTQAEGSLTRIPEADGTITEDSVTLDAEAEGTTAEGLASKKPAAEGTIAETPKKKADKNKKKGNT